MAYTKYSLTPADNNAAPPNGAPEGMLPSAVNDTMRDMMAQIRDVGDGIRGGTYTMTAPVITGGSINGTTIGATTASTGAFSTLAYTGTLTGGTGIVNLGSGQFYKDASGNVGIGTTTLSGKLAIAGSGNQAINVQRTDASTTGAKASFVGYDSSANAVAAMDYVADGADDSSYIRWRTRPTGGSLAERMRIDTSGNVGIGLTPTARNNTRLQIVDGIGFPATQVASSDANTLDDYEEGTWTPTISFTTPGDLSVSYSAQTGLYTKIGRMVFITFNITATPTFTTASGSLTISTAPFASTGASYIGAMHFSNFLFTVGYTMLNPRLGAVSSTVIDLVQSGSGLGPAAITTTNMVSGTAYIMRGTLAYQTTT